MKSIITALAFSLVLVSCNKEEKKRKGVDYNAAKGELALTAEQEKSYDEVVAKYAKIAEESKAAATDGAKPDRVEMFKKMEERNVQQTADMAAFLNEAQLQKYSDFVAKNSRKRPRYDDALLAKIKTDLALDEQQAKMLEAANNAFEKAYQDAHDLYHGNGELAKEYWEKYDAERKNAMKQVLSEEQNAAFLELVKDQKPAAKK